MGNRLINIFYNFNRNNVIEKFFCEILLGGGHNAVSENFGTFFASSYFHILFVEKGFCHGQKFLCDSLVNKQAFGGIANRYPLGLGVINNGGGFFKIGKLVDVDVTVARPRFYNRNRRIFHNRLYKTRSAPRNEQIEKAACPHHFVCRLAARVGHKANAVLGKACVFKGLSHGVCDGDIGIYRFLSASEHNGVARLETNGGGVGRDVGASLVYNAHNAYGHRNFADFKAVWALERVKSPAHWILKAGYLHHPLRHGGQTVVV